MEAGLPLPPLDESNSPWFAWLRTGELRVQKCAGCEPRRSMSGSG
jgi:hypothetical protein